MGTGVANDKAELRRELLLLSQSMASGDTIRVVCPACGEPDMTLTRVSNLVRYICFRASCWAAHGSVALSPGMLRDRKPDAKAGTKPPTSVYTGDLSYISDPKLQEFCKRYNVTLDRSTANSILRESPAGDLVYLIRSPRGSTRGYCVRYANPPDGGPKSRTYRAYEPAYSQENAPLIAWYPPLTHCRVTPGVGMCLVEDCASAIALAELGVTAVSLLGTGLSVERVADIADMRPCVLVIALDYDATSLAFSHARRWGMAFPQTRVSILRKDIKDMDRKERIAYVQHLPLGAASHFSSPTAWGE